MTKAKIIFKIRDKLKQDGATAGEICTEILRLERKPTEAARAFALAIGAINEEFKTNKRRD